jgi:hypothetical protein
MIYVRKVSLPSIYANAPGHSHLQKSMSTTGLTTTKNDGDELIVAMENRHL